MLSAVCFFFTSAPDNKIVQCTLLKCCLLLIAAVVRGHPARGERWSEVSAPVEGENAVVIQRGREAEPSVRSISLKSLL